MVNKVNFLISLSDFSWLVYRNARGFCVLTSYPPILVNSLISYSNFPRQHKQMERYTMFLKWKNQHYENDYKTQSNPQIQCNPYQITNVIFPQN